MILRWGGVGDFLLTLPAVHFIRRFFRNAHIAIMGSSETIALGSSVEYADEFLQFDWAVSRRRRETREAARLAMVRKLREFDFIVNFHPFESLDKLLDESGTSYTSFDDKVFFVQRKHASRNFCDFVRSIPIPAVFSRPRVYLSPRERQFALKYLGDCGLNWRRDRIVAVHAGSGDPGKRWFPDRYRDLVRCLARSGVKVLLLSGPLDGGIVNLVYEGAGSDNVSIVSGLPIRKVAAIIEKSTLFLGNDSGLMHLAAAVDTAVVALFGPSDPVISGPVGNRNVLLVGNCPSRTGPPIHAIHARFGNAWIR